MTKKTQTNWGSPEKRKTPAPPPGSEPDFFPLDSLENCRDCMARAMWSACAGELEASIARLIIDTASKAAKTLMDTGEADEGAASFLKQLAQPQPAIVPQPEKEPSSETRANPASPNQMPN